MMKFKKNLTSTNLLKTSFINIGKEHYLDEIPKVTNKMCR